MGVRMAQSPFQGQGEEQSATPEGWAGGWTLEFSAGERGSQRCRPQGAAIAGFLLDFCAEIMILNSTPALRV